MVNSEIIREVVTDMVIAVMVIFLGINIYRYSINIIDRESNREIVPNVLKMIATFLICAIVGGAIIFAIYKFI